jgi:hypothetical protein
MAHGRGIPSKRNAYRIASGCILPGRSCLLQSTSKLTLRISRSFKIFPNSRRASSIRS